MNGKELIELIRDKNAEDYRIVFDYSDGRLFESALAREDVVFDPKNELIHIEITARN